MEIRDPVHGFVHLSDTEREILDSFPMQRLRNIKQLGMSHYVYPGSTHTRFEHSIGTMYVSTQMFNVLERKHGKQFSRIFSIKDDEYSHRRFRAILRIASLVHDIGHAPFSHATEGLLPENKTHEEITIEILRNELEEIFSKKASRLGVRLEDVAFLISPESVTEVDEEDAKALHLLRTILSGEIDADRIDYLNRDSHHIGVIYGKFDYMRLIETLTIVPYTDVFPSGDISNTELAELITQTIEPRIGVEAGGIHTVEGLILARYFMFLQVYFHPVRRIYDLMLIEFLKEVLPNGTYPKNVNEYLDYDDIKIINLIKEQYASKDCKKAYTIAKRLVERDHPRLVFERKGMPLKIEEFEKEITEKLSEKFDNLDPEVDIYVDTPRKASFKPEESEIYIVRDEVSEELVEKWDYTRTIQELKNGRIQHIRKHSELLESLPNIEILRVYAKLPKVEVLSAERICDKIYKEFHAEGGRDG
ncbi:HD domain-containing protein [Geoglobus sp.]